VRGLAHFCIKIGFLPKHPKFVRFIRRHLFIPLHPRDQATGMTGYFDLGPDITPAKVKRFRDWWRDEGELGL
jgi:hypothetical protein